MVQQVCLQGRGKSESSVTFFTHVGFFARVQQFVLLQISGAVHRLSTLVTGVGFDFLTRVTDAHVSLGVVHGGERRTTHVTGERSTRGMTVHVFVIVFNTGECNTAQRAPQLLLLRMRF